MKEVKVSIIIPAYNVEKYLAVGIESALSQTYKNIEVIVVDDGSSDGTYIIMDKFAKLDDRVIAIKKTNGGVSSARNLGMSKASGDYILFLDSDDWLEKNAVEDLLRLQSDNPAYLITVECFYAKYIDGEYLKNRQGTNNKKVVLSKEDSLISMDKEYRLRSSCFKLFDTAIVRKNKLVFNDKISYGEDGLFVFEYLHFTNGVIYMPIPLWNILERCDSATMSLYSSKWLSWVDAIHLMIENPQNTNKITKYLFSYLQITTMTIMMIGIKSGNITNADFNLLRLELKKCRIRGTELPQNKKSRVQYFLLRLFPLSVLKSIWRLKK